MTSGPRTTSRFAWILDGGSTTHICNDRDAFVTFTPARSTIGSIQKNGPQLEVLGRGDILILCHVQDRDDCVITLRDVSYCPNARDNLVSESRMDRKGLEIRKRNGRLTIKKSSGEIVMEGALRDNLYELDCVIAPPYSTPSDVAFAARTSTPNIDLWHRRLGHISESSLRYMDKHKLVTGLDLCPEGNLGPCDGCAKGKHHRAPFPTQATCKTSILDRIHMDLQGPFDTSVQGFRYALVIVDDYSRKGWKAYLKKKSDATAEIKALIQRLETLTERKVKIVRSDGGGEFIGDELQKWFTGKGISHEASTPYTPQQNGVAERFNQTTHEHALCMLHEAGMSNGFWPEAHEYASYIRNRTPTRALKRVTPNETFHGTKPDVSTLRIFGSRCHVRTPAETRTKLEPHSLDGIFCGFAPKSKAYKVWIPSKHKFVTSRDVIVYEKVPISTDDDSLLPTPASSEGVSTGMSTQSGNNPVETAGDTRSRSLAEKTSSPSTQRQMHDPAPEPTPVPPSTPLPNPTPSASTKSIPAPAPPTLRRSERTARPSWKKQAADAQKAREAATKNETKAKREARADRQEIIEKVNDVHEADENKVPKLHESDIAQLAYLAAYGEETPMSFNEATKSPEADEWWKAMNEEIGMLHKRGTWVLEDLPPGRKAIGCRWTYVIKRGPAGEILRYKARLVAQGFSQIPGVDYDDTFSPTVRLDSLRAVLHLAAAHGWHRGQDDVTGAFLHGKLDCEIYMRQPPGFDDGTGRVARLVLGLYGLKQSSRIWHQHMDEELETIDQKPLVTDPAVYFRCAEDNHECSILCVHADNMLSFAETERELTRLRQQLHKLFEMKEEDPNWLMGFQLIDDPVNHTVSISHRQYVETILKRFHMDGCNTHHTPMENGLILSKADGPADADEEEQMKRTPYRALTGALTWISLISRPDIAFASSYLSQFNANPGPKHWHAAQRVLKYLAKTPDMRLVLGGDSDNATELIGYTDSDWAHDIDDRRSVSAYIWQLGESTVAWSSKKQSTVAASSTEGEYMALSYGAKQGLWMRRFLIEIGLELEKRSTPLLVDNQSSIDLSKEARFHARTKHIDVQHHFIRERVADETFVVKHCPSKLNLADGLTKPLPREPFEIMVDGLGLVLN